LRRLFSTFARGWPGVGLLLLRVVAGISLISHAVLRVQTHLPIKSSMTEVFAIAIGLFLFLGFCTPIAGLLLMILEIWAAFAQPGDSWANILLATIGIALALIGPGALSVDARRFGWKRIDIRDRNS
jgi:putative oxidoreductase